MTKPMPLKQAMCAARLKAILLTQQTAATMDFLVEYHRALAERGWPLWPQEPTEEMVTEALATLPGGASPIFHEDVASALSAAATALPSLDELLKEEK